jgi:broad specificity phosphatase PhoE
MIAMRCYECTLFYWLLHGLAYFSPARAGFFPRIELRQTVGARRAAGSDSGRVLARNGRHFRPGLLRTGVPPPPHRRDCGRGLSACRRSVAGTRNSPRTRRISGHRSDAMERHEDIRALETEFRQAGDRSAAFRVYDKLFQRITRMWVDEELDSPEVESWRRFCDRVDHGIGTIREGALKNGRVVVFTSGGVIAATVRKALDLSPQRTLELSWTSRNASYTEFLFSLERFSLSSFNSHPNLEDGEMLTYR